MVETKINDQSFFSLSMNYERDRTPYVCVCRALLSTRAMKNHMKNDQRRRWNDDNGDGDENRRKKNTEIYEM